MLKRVLFAPNDYESQNSKPIYYANPGCLRELLLHAQRRNIAPATWGRPNAPKKNKKLLSAIVSAPGSSIHSSCERCAQPGAAFCAPR